MPKCWNCGTDLPEGAVYCSNCGRPTAGPGLSERTVSQVSPSAMYAGGSEELIRRVRATQTYSLVAMILIILLWIYILI
jgi:predicted amidophosphoribosyltransferase